MGGDSGGNLISIRCKAMGDCHSELPICNEYMLIKMRGKKIFVSAYVNQCFLPVQLLYANNFFLQYWDLNSGPTL
jgi:hypothetical protein